MLAAGCSSGEAPPAKPEAPAHVDAPRPEAEFTTVKLSAEAVKRLGIETVAARIDTAAATRSLGGEVTVPEGRMVTVTAPVAGTLSAVSGIQPGARVTRGTRLMTLAPLASSERDQTIEARRAVEAAQADADTARLRLQRLEQLLKDGAASVRSVEEARGQFKIAEAALNAAQERLAAIRQGPVGPQGEIADHRAARRRRAVDLGGAGADRVAPRPRCCRSPRSARYGSACRCSPGMSTTSTRRSPRPSHGSAAPARRAWRSA